MKNRVRNLFGAQKGFSLMDTMIAVAILAMIGVGFLQALFIISKGTDTHEKRAIAASLAQSQVEYVKGTEYLPGGDYDVVVALPPGYSMSTETVQEETGKQKVTVEVYRQEDFVLKMTTLKVDW